MWSFSRRFNLLNLSRLLTTQRNSSGFWKTPFANTLYELNIRLVEDLPDCFHPSVYPIPHSSYSTFSSSPNLTTHEAKVFNFSSGANAENGDDVGSHDMVEDEGTNFSATDDEGNACSDDDDDDEDNKTNTNQLSVRDDKFDHDLGVIMDILRSKGGDSTSSRGAEVKDKLNHCGVPVSSELVVKVLSRIRNDWEIAFAFFLWAGRQPGHVHSAREYHSMISILAKRRKFDTAWGLIDEMKKIKGNNDESFVTLNTIVIMIRRYCAIHDVGSAINAFHALKRFNIEVGLPEFQQLLAALCRYKNVQDAEHLLFSNKKTFPFETKSFNIILNGWCNVVGSPRESKRFWKVMLEHRITLDVVSYSSIISSYAKSNRLKEALKLYDKMKRRGIAADRKVYNAIIFALAKGGKDQESRNVLKTMEDEGIPPNAVTYNSLIKPLCRAKKGDEAQKVFEEMLGRGLQPTIRTYHALLHVQRTAEDIFKLLDKMRETGCEPEKDTYIMLVRKLCRWKQLDDVFKLWGEMDELGMNEDSGSYIVLIHGLFLNGKMEEAHKIYEEMKERSLFPDPKTDELIQTWLANKEMAALPTSQSLYSLWESFDVDSSRQGSRVRTYGLNREKCFQKRPEERRVVRDRGFSFWK